MKFFESRFNGNKAISNKKVKIICHLPEGQAEETNRNRANEMSGLIYIVNTRKLLLVLHIKKK